MTKLRLMLNQQGETFCRFLNSLCQTSRFAADIEPPEKSILSVARLKWPWLKNRIIIVIIIKTFLTASVLLESI